MLNLFLKISNKAQAMDIHRESGKEINSKHTACLTNCQVPQGNLHVTCKVVLPKQQAKVLWAVTTRSTKC